MLIIYASVWLTVCAAWIGFTRRHSFLILFTALATNAFLLAGLGIAERGLGADKIFWLWKPPAGYFVSSFIYKNHAGAYFDLVLSLCAGLAYWHYERSQRRLDKSSPSGLFAFFATAVAIIVCFSYSRTATLLMFAFLIVLLAVFLWRQFAHPVGGQRNPLIVFVLLCALGIFVSIGMKSLRIATFVERMTELRKQLEEPTPGARMLAAAATWDLAREKIVTGSGSGSFRFLFPIYQQNYPPIHDDHGRRLYWEHAHNDYLEGLAEVGLVGAGLVLAALAYAAFCAVKLRVWGNPLALCVLGGTLLTLIHNAVDFNFYNPAILTTWWVLLFATLRWVQLEELAVKS
jgi:O-antigen ligase